MRQPRALQPPSPLQYASLDVGPPSTAMWSFTNVRVEQADVALEASVCFSGALLQVGGLRAWSPIFPTVAVTIAVAGRWTAGRRR